MAWQENLFSNLLVVGILLALFIIVYCKMKNITLPELIKEIKEATSVQDE